MTAPTPILDEWEQIAGDITDEDLANLNEEERTALLGFLQRKMTEWTFARPGMRNERALLAEALLPKVDWLLYGGAAGGAKSEVGLKHAHDLSVSIPGHATLVLRTSRPELRRSLVMRSIARFRQIGLSTNGGAKLRNQENVLAWHTANGSTIEFGYCVAGDTPIAMADGTFKRMDEVVVGDLVETLEGPRPVYSHWHVGMKPAVEITLPSGDQVVASESHALLAAEGQWLPPFALGSAAATTPRPDCTTERPSTEADPSSLRLGAGSIPRRRGRRGWQPIVQPSLPSSAWVLALHGEVAGRRESERVRSWSSAQGSPGGCPTGTRSDGGLLLAPRAADQACTPPLDDAGRSFPLRLAGGPASTPSRSQWWESETYSHPYTTADRPLSVGVLRSTASIARVGERDLWDMSVLGASHYVSSGGIVHRNCSRDGDESQYLSAEYDFVWFDEATQFTSEQILAIVARLRTTHEKAGLGARPHALFTTNPGERSHAWFYDRFVLPTDYGRWIIVFDVSDGFESPKVSRVIECPQVAEDVAGLEIGEVTDDEIVVAFIQSKATDNPFIAPSYRKYLSALPETERKQKRDGDWDVYSGMFFYEWNRDIHVIPPFEIPSSWQRGRGIDFGSTAPFSCHWGAWDNDGNLFIYQEAYQAGMVPSEQAKMVVDLSRYTDENGTVKLERYTHTVADPSVFTNTGAGLPIAKQWAQHGLHVVRANNDRIAGWATFREYLRLDPSSGRPRLFVFSTCTNLARTIPMQQRDKKRPEDLDTKLEDHAVDSLRYLMMIRPRGAAKPRNHDSPGQQGQWERMARRLSRERRRN